MTLFEWSCFTLGAACLFLALILLLSHLLDRVFTDYLHWKQIYWGFVQMICFPKQWDGWLKKCEKIYGDKQKALNEEVELPSLEKEPTETKEI